MTTPSSYGKMHERHPRIMASYEAFNDACKAAGPLDERSVSLVKLAVSMGAGLDGAARSHARKALEAGCTREELSQVALLCAPTLGFPFMMRAYKTLLEIIGESELAQ